VGGFSLWKNDNNVCQNVYVLPQGTDSVNICVHGPWLLCTSGVAKFEQDKIFMVLGKCFQMSNRKSLVVSGMLSGMSSARCSNSEIELFLPP